MSAREMCADCGADLTVHEAGHSFASGVALIGEQRARVCYGCAEVFERHEWERTARDGGAFVCYLSSDGRSLTGWPGWDLARVTYQRAEVRHTPSGGRHEVTYLRAVDFAGRLWYGRGMGRGMLCRVRPVRGGAR